MPATVNLNGFTNQCHCFDVYLNGKAVKGGKSGDLPINANTTLGKKSKIHFGVSIFFQAYYKLIGRNMLTKKRKEQCESCGLEFLCDPQNIAACSCSQVALNSTEQAYL